MVKKVQKAKVSSLKTASAVKKVTKGKKAGSLPNGFQEKNVNKIGLPADLPIDQSNGSPETQESVATEQPAHSAENVSTKATNIAQNSRKRKSPTSAKVKTKEAKSGTKRQKVLLEVPAIGRIAGKVFVIGENGVGQLGFGEDVQLKKRPAVLELPHSIVDIAAGGMHSVCLTESGEVITFGCNDEGALGREGAEHEPLKVDIPERIVQVSAGDSHSAALSDSGQVYIWGNFRNGSGVMGLVRSGTKQTTPVKILNNITIVKITSGSEHLVCLSKDGSVYTCGCGEAGQLGRVHELACDDGGRKGIMLLLSPDKVPIARSQKAGSVDDIWTGSYTTFVKTQDSGLIYGFGLNNYNQLGCEDPIKIFKPKQITSFNNELWQQMNGGQHHTLALNDAGLVYSLGREEYGRLGLGENSGIKSVPTVISALQDKKCIEISSGECVSFAVSDDGNVFSWGFGENNQLGHGNDDDQHLPRLIEGNFLNSWKAFKISGGGQHTLILAHPRRSAKENKE